MTSFAFNHAWTDDEDDDLFYGLGMRSWVEKTLQMQRLMKDSTGPLTEVQGWIIKAHLDNGDEAGAKELIQDWNAQRDRKLADVSKWLPGDHYYALDKKFDTLDGATRYLESKGFKFSGCVRERFMYRESGG